MGETMEYGRILKESWITIWKHKVIIWVGFLMVIPSLIMAFAMGGFFFFFDDIFPFAFEPYAPAPDINPFVIVLIVVFFFGFMIFSYAMLALSFAGVVKGTFDLESKDDSISFGELWAATLPYVWRIFGVFFLVFFVIFLFFGIIMFIGAMVGALTAGIGFLCLMPLFLLILPLELLAYLFASLAMVAIVVDDLGVFESLGRAWYMMKQKFWPLVLMAIILVFIQWAMSMIVVLPMQVVQFFIMFSMDITSYAPDPSSFFQPFSILMALFIPISSLIQGLGFTYANAAWTLTYLRLTHTQDEEQPVALPAG